MGKEKIRALDLTTRNCSTELTECFDWCFDTDDSHRNGHVSTPLVQLNGSQIMASVQHGAFIQSTIDATGFIVLPTIRGTP